MAKEFLDRAQIPAARQKMGGEGVAQRMRRGARGKAERAAQARNRALYDARRKRPASRAAKDRLVGLHGIGALGEVFAHALANLRQSRNDAHASPLAEDGEAALFERRQIAPP